MTTGFCSRCGERLRDGQRCSCGGCSITPRSLRVLQGRSQTPDGDSWARTYVQKSPAATISKAGLTDGNVNQHTHLSPPVCNVQSTLSAGSPSKQRRDMFNHPNINTSHPDTPDEADINETVSRAFGSVLDPQHKRSKWSCAACSVMFIRDQTVYPDPRAKDQPELADKLYCPGCFGERFSLGTCQVCCDAVLPDAAYPFIQRKDKLWHASCYACLYCSKDLSKDPMVDLYGNPCCAHCFDTAAFLKAPSNRTVPALLSADIVPITANTAKQGSAESDEHRLRRKKIILSPGATRLGPSLSELRNRLGEAGVEAAAAMDTRKALATSARLVTVSNSTASGSQGNTSGHPTAPPMLRAQSEISLASTTPAWVRHRSAASTTALPTRPAAFVKMSSSTSAEASSTSTSTLTLVPPLSFLADQPKSAPLPQGRFPRPQRTGRSQSAFTVPSLSELKSRNTTVQNTAVSSLSASLGAATSSGTEKLTTPSPKQPLRKQSNLALMWEAKHSANDPSSPPPVANLAVSTPLPRPPSTPSSRQAAVAQQTSNRMDAHPILRHEPRPTEGPSPISASPNNSKVIPQPALVEQKCRDLLTHPIVSATLATDQSRPQPNIDADSRCAGCHLRLFTVANSASTASGPASNKVIRTEDAAFHARCFVCSKCKNPLNGGSFVQLDNGQRVHERCAPPLLQLQMPSAPSGESAAKVTMPDLAKDASTSLSHANPSFRTSNVAQKPFTSPSIQNLRKESAAQMTPFSPSKIQIQHLPGSKAPTKLSRASEVFARSNPAPTSAGQTRPSSVKLLGGMYKCAGCEEMGTLAETTIGPVGTRFHHGCLKCACGKKLDSGAKSLQILSENNEVKRKFACRDCIDKDRLMQRSHSAASGKAALRSRN